MRRAVAYVAVVIASGLIASAASVTGQPQEAPRFGGSYSQLDARRRALVDNWVSRFSRVTGQNVGPAAFYDTFVKISAKTTFDAITHALMTTALTDAAGNRFGDALQVVEQIDEVRGQATGTPGDHQFRMFVRLTPDALDTLARSRQFVRRGDNTVYHEGYPINFRGRGGTPSIQISVALDKRRADVDVDYRSSSFPLAMFNGHLTASNSDVRAGSNYDRHTQQWSGFQNWWRNFFGVSLSTADEAEGDKDNSSDGAPRAGKKPVETLTEDFLKAWLLEGNIKEAMGYISPRAYACMAEDADDPSTFDRGMAPFVLQHRLKASHDALGPHTSLEGLTVGVRLTKPGLRLVKQPHHAQFVVYAIPDDVAALFDCESSFALSAPVKRAYGNYVGATFYIKGTGTETPLALLWGRDRGYWQIVSWLTEPEGDRELPANVPPATNSPQRISADTTLVDAARGFLDSWLIRKDYDKAFAYLAPASYSCYQLNRRADQPPASSLVEAGRKIREALAQAGDQIGRADRLESIISAAPPVHPAVRAMDHRYAGAFSLSSVPDALVEAVNCDARAKGDAAFSDRPPTYGTGFGMTVRFRTRAGDPPVLRTLWLKEAGAWRITAYDVELP